MGKRRRAKKGNGPEDFEQYYKNLYGERWEDLRPALLQDTHYHELSSGLLKSYFLDEASFTAASSLTIQPGMKVLDMCAAPGGKSLVLLSNLLSEHPGAPIDFTANERSATRRGRLKRVLEEHLGEEIYSRLRVTGHDAGTWGKHESETYDAILLDVPCSSERHLLQEPKHLESWSAGRSSRLAQQAYAFLLSAITCLKPGGVLLYSTCALASKENDEVIERAMTRIHKKGLAAVVTANKRVGTSTSLPDWVEDTALGFIILPDRSAGRGPIFFSTLKKL